MAPMMRLILGLGVLVFILSAVALGLPAHVTASRSVDINAPEYVVFPYVNNLRRYRDWAPWADRDPNIKITYSGPPEGSGAKAEWESNVPSAGSGSIQILESNAPNDVNLAMNFKGLEGMSTIELSPAGAGSKATWSFGFETGSSPIKRWKGLMLDRFVGDEYKRGLEKLKQKVEADRASTARQPVVAPAPAPAMDVPETPAPAEAPAEPAPPPQP